ncbi:hypothetical protein EIN_238520 [Entamoeba invadens IP1]|uniref:Uncharacterized protein n=1 Tax=Entamoeba invadens IP1 TaxID=370355 RepID=A0A0A1UCR2_ENTIV|nr:hypothetical protein EIN_238520 [Entamoeba invadens IP1]ELP93622.1 hypothetical protein EIN_238520 [Entamoeba invadens IP1]|eukprot:XP_004260393.1 hypothetical protein EIN_238520 [Entamoeba invadens IP1]
MIGIVLKPFIIEKLDKKKKLEIQNEDAGLKEKVENITQENEKLKKRVEENEKEKERITQQIQGLEGERETYKQLVEKKEIDIQNLLTENAKKTTPGEQGKTIDVDEYNVVVAEKEKIKTNMEKMREGIYRELNKLQTQNQQITQELLGGLEQIKQSTKVLIDENKRARWILDLLKTDEKEKKTN